MAAIKASVNEYKITRMTPYTNLVLRPDLSAPMFTTFYLFITLLIFGNLFSVTAKILWSSLRGFTVGLLFCILC